MLTVIASSFDVLGIPVARTLAGAALRTHPEVVLHAGRKETLHGIFNPYDRSDSIDVFVKLPVNAS